jgi:hypothetical protein
VTPGLTSSSIGTQSTSSSTFTLPSALVSDALDIIVIGIAVPISSGSNSVSSVSDSAGNVYTRQSQSSVTGFDGEVWIAQSPTASSSNSITIVLASAATNWTVVAGSYAGVALLQAVGSPYTTTGTTISASVTPTTGGACIVALVLTEAAVTYTPNSTTVGYTDIPGTGTSSRAHQAYTFNGVMTPNNFGATLSSSQTLLAVAIALVPVPLGPIVSASTQVAIASGSSGTTPGFNVDAGDSVYIFVSYACAAGATDVSTVKDSGSLSYALAGKIQNTGSTPAYPAQEIWYLDYATAQSALTVTVTMSASCEFIVSVLVIRGANALGSLDAVSSGSIGTGAASSDAISILSPNALVIACLCAQRGGTYFTSSGGFIGVLGGTVGSVMTGVNANIWALNGPRIGSYNSDLTAAVAEPWAILTVAIRPTPTYGFSPGATAVTVGSLGLANGGSVVPNGGAQFGPDTPGTATCGIQEAISAVATTGGGTVSVLPGTYLLAYYVSIATANVVLNLDPGAIIQLPAAPNWSVLTTPSASRSPLIVISDASNVSILGGQFQMLSSGSPSLNGTGIHIGHGCTHILVQGGYFQGFTRFAILVTGYDNVSGTGVGSPTADVTVEGCWMINCGNTTTPDGGGIRFGNASGQLASGFRAIRNYMTGIVMFGIDVNNPGSSPMSEIAIALNDIQVIASGMPQSVGINLEKSSSPAPINTRGVLIEQNHVSGGYNCLLIQGGVAQVTVHGGLYEGAWHAPILLSAPNASTLLSDVILDGVIAKNGGQSTPTVSNNGGIEISTQNSSDAGIVQNIQIANCRCLDDQGSGLQTQAYGLNFYNDGTHAASNLTIQNVIVNGGKFDGNKTGDVNIDLVGSSTCFPPVFHVPVTGSDNRTGVHSTDLSALPLWTPLSNSVYQITLYLNATVWAAGTGTYTVSYVLTDGTPKVLIASATAADQNVSAIVVACVKGGSLITGQLTGSGGFSMTVSISVTLTQIG